MKIYPLLFIIFFASRIFAQQSGDIQITEDMIRADFSKIKPENYSYLIPFYQKDAWGYLDKRTKKIVVPARYQELALFHPGMKYGYTDDFKFEIDSAGKIGITSHDNYDGPPSLGSWPGGCGSGVKVVSSENGYKGFSLDSSGRVLSYSDIYDHEKGCPWNIIPFKTKHGYMAIANNKKGMWGIIDSLGNPMQGFDFNYEDIYFNKYAKDTGVLWFFVKDSTGNWSVKSETGELKFKNEIVDWPYANWTLFGISHIQNLEGKFGIFDCYEMKWILRPQSAFQIYGWLQYSSRDVLDEKKPADREKASIYYMANEGDAKYYMDLKGNKYLPLK
jgi:hypothetical protein